MKYEIAIGLHCVSTCILPCSMFHLQQLHTYMARCFAYIAANDRLYVKEQRFTKVGVVYRFTSVVRMLITKLAIVWEKLAGETLANLWSFATFANVSPHQSFPPYGICQ